MKSFFIVALLLVSGVAQAVPLTDVTELLSQATFRNCTFHARATLIGPYANVELKVLKGTQIVDQILVASLPSQVKSNWLDKGDSGILSFAAGTSIGRFDLSFQLSNGKLYLANLYAGASDYVVGGKRITINSNATSLGNSCD